MKRRFLFCLTLVLALCLGFTSMAKAGPFFPPYWQLDARVQFVPQQVNVVVPTGYWGGPFAYLGYPAFYGPLYTYPGIYGVYPWRGGPYYYGFRDRLVYSYTAFVPRLVYWNSWYWDPQGTSHTLDLITGADENAGALLPLDSTVPSDLTVTAHTWDIDGGYSTGSFTPLLYTPIGVDGTDLFAAVHTLTNMDASTFDAFQHSPIVQNLLAHAQADDIVGLQYSGPGPFPTPEPSTLVLYGTGIFGMLGYGWHRRRQLLARGD